MPSSARNGRTSPLARAVRIRQQVRTALDSFATVRELQPFRDCSTVELKLGAGDRPWLAPRRFSLNTRSQRRRAVARIWQTPIDRLRAPRPRMVSFRRFAFDVPKCWPTIANGHAPTRLPRFTSDDAMSKTALGEVEIIPRRLLLGNPSAILPKLSPDGRYLAWLAPADGVMNVWTAPFDAVADAGPLTRLPGRPPIWH